MKQSEKDKIREYVEDYVPCFTPCIGCETTERYIGIMAEKHGQRRLDEDNIDQLQTSLGFVLNESGKKEFMKIWKEVFKRVMLEYQVELKRCKNEEEKDLIKKNGVKRKPQLSENTKKKSKRK